MSTTEGPIRLSTIDEAECQLVEECAGEDWSNEHPDAAAEAFEAVRNFYKKMERRPSHGAFQVMVAQHFLAWMSDAYVTGEPLFED
jgi:hypothetical protein